MYSLCKLYSTYFRMVVQIKHPANSGPRKAQLTKPRGPREALGSRALGFFTLRFPCIMYYLLDTGYVILYTLLYPLPMSCEGPNGPMVNILKYLAYLDASLRVLVISYDGDHSETRQHGLILLICRQTEHLTPCCGSKVYPGCRRGMFVVLFFCVLLIVACER